MVARLINFKGVHVCAVCGKHADNRCMEYWCYLQEECDTWHCNEHPCPIHPPGWEEQRRLERESFDLEKAERFRRRLIRATLFLLTLLIFGVSLRNCLQ